MAMLDSLGDGGNDWDASETNVMLAEQEDERAPTCPIILPKITSVTHANSTE